MPLTNAQVETTRRAARESSFDDIKARADDLETEQQTALIELMGEWNLLDKKRHLRISGSRDGVDLNYDRRLTELRKDIRVMLRLPISSGLSRIPVASSSYSECDA